MKQKQNLRMPVAIQNATGEQSHNLRMPVAIQNASREQSQNLRMPVAIQNASREQSPNLITFRGFRVCGRVLTATGMPKPRPPLPRKQNRQTANRQHVTFKTTSPALVQLILRQLLFPQDRRRLIDKRTEHAVENYVSVCLLVRCGLGRLSLATFFQRLGIDKTMVFPYGALHKPHPVTWIVMPHKKRVATRRHTQQPVEPAECAETLAPSHAHTQPSHHI